MIDLLYREEFYTLTSWNISLWIVQYTGTVGVSGYVNVLNVWFSIRRLSNGVLSINYGSGNVPAKKSFLDRIYICGN